MFWDASAYRLEVSAGETMETLHSLGVHMDLNVNTGFGARKGNVEGHCVVFFLFLFNLKLSQGWGGKIGWDGVQLDTPFGGVSAGLPLLTLAWTTCLLLVGLGGEKDGEEYRLNGGMVRGMVREMEGNGKEEGGMRLATTDL